MVQEKTQPPTKPALAEATPAEIETVEEEKKWALLSPEGFLMMSLAAMLDLVGIILIFFGLDDFGITDIIGIIFIGGWMFFRSQTITVTKKAATKIVKAVKWFKKIKWLKPLLGAIEFIPYGGVLPLWTLIVWFELKN